MPALSTWHLVLLDFSVEIWFIFFRSCSGCLFSFAAAGFLDPAVVQLTVSDRSGGLTRLKRYTSDPDHRPRTKFRYRFPNILPGVRKQLVCCYFTSLQHLASIRWNLPFTRQRVRLLAAGGDSNDHSLARTRQNRWTQTGGFLSRIHACIKHKFRYDIIHEIHNVRQRFPDQHDSFLPFGCHADQQSTRCYTEN